MSKKKLSDKELIMRSGALLAEMYQVIGDAMFTLDEKRITCLLYTSPSPRD